MAKYEILEDCVNCTACLNACPEGAISELPKYSVIDQEKCTGCGICFDVCLINVVLKDGQRPMNMD